MASPVYASQSNNTGTSTSIAFTEPTGASSGDGLLLFLVLQNGFSGLSGLSGWTQEKNQSVNSEFTGLIYSIRRGASAPDLNLSWTTSEYFDWSLARITGIVGSGTWIETIVSNTPSVGTTIDTPSATPLTTNTLAISAGWNWAGMDNLGHACAVPAGYTRGFGQVGYDQAHAWKALSTTAAEDPAAWEACGSSDGIWGNTIIIASQAAAGGGSTIVVPTPQTPMFFGGFP